MSVLIDSDKKMLELLRKAQNCQYDNQRGTSLAAFQDLPEFLREPTDRAVVDSASLSVSGCQTGSGVVSQNILTAVSSGSMDSIDTDSSSCASFVTVASSASNSHRDTLFDDFAQIIPFDELDGTMPKQDFAECYFGQAKVDEPFLDLDDPVVRQQSLRDIGIEPSSSYGARTNFFPDPMLSTSVIH